MQGGVALRVRGADELVFGVPGLAGDEAGVAAAVAATAAAGVGGLDGLGALTAQVVAVALAPAGGLDALHEGAGAACFLAPVDGDGVAGRVGEAGYLSGFGVAGFPLRPAGHFVMFVLKAFELAHRYID